MLILNNVKPILDSIISAGGTPYLVGGCVRDHILGLSCKDIDIEVFDISLNVLTNVLSQYGDVDCVGKSFGVVKLRYNDIDLDFSLPRLDHKTGEGHKGFDVEHKKDISIEEAAARRDFTINSMSMDISGNLIDVYGGSVDLHDGILCATSSAFIEDELRVLRGMQFCARFNLVADRYTLMMCRKLIPKINSIPKERVFGEWYKWAEKCQEPSRGICFLRSSGWLPQQIENLIDIPQDPEWHPEGWSHTISFNTCDARSTISDIIDLDIFRQTISNTQTRQTLIESFTSTPITQVISNTSIDSFTSTLNTRTFGLQFPSTFTKTITAQSKTFVFTSTRTTATDKSTRIMFKIPISRMLSIMNRSIDNFEIIDGIISTITIYMMNMLSSQQLPTNTQLHNESMNPQTSSFGPTNFHVFANIVQFLFNIIDNDIVLSIDICFDDNSWNHLIHPFLFKKDSPHSIIRQKPVISLNCGDVFIHNQYVLDAMADICKRENITGENKVILMFAALCHDFGKVSTTKFEDGRIRARGHDVAGVEPARIFLENIGCFPRIIEKVLPLVREHMVHCYSSNGQVNLKKLSNRLYPANINELLYVIEADHSGRPPLEKGLPEQCHSWKEQANALQVLNDKPKPIIMGRHLIEMRLKPGREFKDILNDCYIQQLDGVFSDLEGGLLYLRGYINGCYLQI